MFVSITYAECDGCGLRVQGVTSPDDWITVVRNTKPDTMYCSSICYSSNDGVPARTIIIARGSRLGLTERDIELLNHLAMGQSNSEIARLVDHSIREQTVKNRLTMVYRALGVEDRLQAVLVASQLGLIDMADLAAHVHRFPD